MESIKLMIRTLGKLWRIGVSGVSFAFFGLSTWLASLVLLPWYRWRSSNPEIYKRKVQRLIQRFFRLFVLTLQALGFMRIRFHNTERFFVRDEPCVLVANHPTLIDVVMLLSQFPHTTCIIKASLYENFFLKRMVEAAGYVCNRDNAKELLEQCTKALERGDSLLIFPEGTRSEQTKLQPFQRGAARIALQGSYPIVPVVITCNPPMLQKGQPWYDVPEKPASIHLYVQPPLAPSSLVEANASPPAAARQLTRYLQDYFTEQLSQKES